MFWSWLVFLACTLGARGVYAQDPGTSGLPPTPPRDVVEKLWNMGVSGELLNADGWRSAAGYFSEPSPMPNDNSFDVFSNRYGFYNLSISNDRAEVDMEFWNSGHIDSELLYTPPPKTIAFKTAEVFHLELKPTYIRMFGADGKTEVERKPTGTFHWEIKGSLTRRWTTVNSAVRYVLEMRNKTTDPLIKRNADETLAKLLTLH